MEDPLPSNPTYPSTVRCVTTILQDNGDIAENVIHFQFNGDHPTATQLNAVGVLCETAWDSHLKAYCPITATFVRTRAFDLTDVPYAQYVADYAVAGTGAGNQLPAQLAACLSLHSTQAGRRGRGRIFAGPLNSAALQSSGALSTAYQTALLAYGAQLIAGVSSGGELFKLAVLSRVNGFSYTVESVTLDSRPDVQRRRANRRIF